MNPSNLWQQFDLSIYFINFKGFFSNLVSEACRITCTRKYIITVRLQKNSKQVASTHTNGDKITLIRIFFQSCPVEIEYFLDKKPSDKRNVSFLWVKAHLTSSFLQCHTMKIVQTIMTKLTKWTFICFVSLLILWRIPPQFPSKTINEQTYLCIYVNVDRPF